MLKSKLQSCKHLNTNAFNYVRDDGLIDEIVNSDDYKRRQQLEDHLSGMRYCLDCGATQRFRRYDPLGIVEKCEPWLQPWIFRK